MTNTTDIPNMKIGARISPNTIEMLKQLMMEVRNAEVYALPIEEVNLQQVEIIQDWLSH